MELYKNIETNDEEYYAKNKKDKKKEYIRHYNEQNKEKIKERQKDYYQKNKEKIILWQVWQKMPLP